MPKAMKTQRISQAVTRAGLVLVFLVVIGFSLYLPDQLDWDVVAFALIKGMLAVGFAWIFFAILSDALVKSIAATADPEAIDPREERILFNFVEGTEAPPPAAPPAPPSA